MATFDILMPKLGESIQEATITKWFKKVGDVVEEEDVLLEIATDKVDSEIPSPVDGKIVKILFNEDALVPVGEVIAVIDMDGDATIETESSNEKTSTAATTATNVSVKAESISPAADYAKSERFYSPLVKTIAQKEHISVNELDSIQGSGHNGRVKKEDLIDFIENRGSKPQPAVNAAATVKTEPVKHEGPIVKANQGDEIVKMDRMRKLIADHMVMSKQVSPHVTNFIETDVTNLAFWRNKQKDAFEKREGIKLTYMPVFLEAVAKALRKFPGVNASVDGDNIILRKNVNLGVAVALPSGNLIVPVVKNADQKNLTGLAIDLNRLATAARNNKLDPDDIQGGTFTISNFGSFKNLTGTPVINQPQAAILATGTIEKKPAVVETPTGDVIAIRHKMILSLSYDHRIIDGALAGGFLKYLSDLLEGFDMDRQA